MTVYRFVQVADIHFGQEQDGERLAHDDVREMLLKDVGHLTERRGPAHLIIIVGDTAFAGKEDEYRRAGEWLDRLTEAAKCGVSDIRVVPGNHDCDWSKFGLVGELVHARIRECTPKSANAVLEQLGRDTEEA